MGSLRITELDIDDGNLVDLCRHRVSPEEVYQCMWNRKKVRYDCTNGGRLLFVVLVDLGGALVRPISARDMTPAERRYFKADPLQSRLCSVGRRRRGTEGSNR